MKLRGELKRRLEERSLEGLKLNLIGELKSLEGLKLRLEELLKKLEELLNIGWMSLEE